MDIKTTAVAGTLESSDIQIMLTPLKGGIEISLESSVQKQFGEQIKAVIKETLAVYQIKNAHVEAIDKGALDCTIKARTITAIQRALEETEQVNWEVL
ncbi:citrate lyase acyl carrier protein [Vagococcus salmoninarum]|uniref:Citrate lyase acyl carrier protein n=1 Tax=Vagococcus salmoninarum TaxID=2739 RepID=A0A429ZM29_9ENTE|nr:citrate lyase acyl carrier protein [Vagococcus salmoninarum]MBE9389599.1 citrate lyase acyl carrier protein [Vagococcus salmoninarum]RST94719.1 citrate lyase acyl carrier protein [Vagococcus salmoninarum]